MLNGVPRLTLIMPVRNEAAHLPGVLESLARQSFDHERLFLIAADGESSDGSAEILRAWLASSDIRGLVLRNTRRTIPAGLNMAIREADPSTFIVRLDSHTIYGSDYIAAIVAAFESAEPAVVAVGGSQHPAHPTSFQGAVVASLLLNPMGLGGADFRTAQSPRCVEHVYLGAWRPGLVQDLGGFDEAWRANEDGEFSARIRAHGHKILWVPLDLRYRPKRGALGTVAQWTRYGYWRAQTLRRHPRATRPRHVLPPALLIASLWSVVASGLRALSLACAIYTALVLIRRPKSEPLIISLASCIFFPICQIGYAAGLLFGLVMGPWTVATRGLIHPIPERINT